MHRYRQRRDRLARALITAGGIGVLMAVLAIGVFLAVEVIPLFFPSDDLPSETAPRLTLSMLWQPQPYGDNLEYRWLPYRLEESGTPYVSLVPLAWGTLEAAAWALVLAVPLALGAAIHSSLYMSRHLRTRIKPTLELMEAMPSVVLGFIAGLVLGPWVELHLAMALMTVLLLPLGVLCLAGARRCLPGGWRLALSLRWASLWLIPWLLLLVWLAHWLAPLFEDWWFGGDLRLWIETWLGWDVEARNALILGLAMGFAVMPGIYALAEDALVDVPRGLSDGAQAMGATRWQTLTRVVLPVAWPGIFSAMMIGAGRAVGETMIVLMASGNTALMSANPLDGLRSLASSIAIELPEAGPGGTHYRLLLLAALALFLFTFLVNTLAELVRTRLRRRFRIVRSDP
ncbi:hypothetical protein BJB45_20345 [Halomonas huangheensis]|uniref:ABC transmembrane type-1 domain-containing protein n=1 Tax=Halomonas huangheensis TaxID=1178482 RepID=W1N5U4_9GAMM|nr:hypothetical protein BJB45_20345 [Halomonas huangheensis]